MVRTGEGSTRISVATCIHVACVLLIFEGIRGTSPPLLDKKAGPHFYGLKSLQRPGVLGCEARYLSQASAFRMPEQGQDAVPKGWQRITEEIESCRNQGWGNRTGVDESAQGQEKLNAPTYTEVCFAPSMRLEQCRLARSQNCTVPTVLAQSIFWQFFGKELCQNKQRKCLRNLRGGEGSDSDESGYERKRMETLRRNQVLSRGWAYPKP
jgi:hypothetical protein